MEAIEIETTQCMLAGSKLPTSDAEVSNGWAPELDLIDDAEW